MNDDSDYAPVLLNNIPDKQAAVTRAFVKKCAAAFPTVPISVGTTTRTSDGHAMYAMIVPNDGTFSRSSLTKIGFDSPQSFDRRNGPSTWTLPALLLETTLPEPFQRDDLEAIARQIRRLPGIGQELSASDIKYVPGDTDHYVISNVRSVTVDAIFGSDAKRVKVDTPQQIIMIPAAIMESVIGKESGQGRKL